MSTLSGGSSSVQTWPSWCDDHRWTITTPEADGPRPTAGPDFIPSDEDLCEAAGFELGYSGEPRPDVTDLTISTPLYLAATRGWIAGRGQRAYDREMDRLRTIDEEYEAHLDGRALARLEDDFTSPPFEGDGYRPGYTT